MAHVTKPRVGETSTTTGTGDLTLAAALTAHQRFSAVCSVADTVFYDISAVDSNGAETGDWEEGVGTYSALNTLTRTTVLNSSTGSAVSFAAGTKYVRLVAEARQIAGVPRGGTSGQVVKKNSATDYDESWATLTSSDVSLGSVTNDAQTKAAIVPNTAPSAGEVLIGNAGNTAYAKQAVSGDITLSSAGAVAVTKINGVSLAGLATGILKNTTTTGVPSIAVSNTDYAAPPSVITASPSTDQNDYAPTSFGSSTTTLILTPSAAFPQITGLSSTGFATGQQLTLRNDSTTLPAMLTEQSSSSSAANRFSLAGIDRAHFILWPGDVLRVEFNGSRWVRAGRATTLLDRWVRRGAIAAESSATLSTSGVNNTNSGLATAALASTGGYLAESARLKVQTTSGAANSAFIRNAGAVVIGDAAGCGGLIIQTIFGGSANPANAGASFIGVRAAATDIGDVDPSSVTNIFGIGTDATQSTFRRLTNDGSGTATATNLGANYAWDTTSVFDFTFFCPANGGAFCGSIFRKDDLTVAPITWYVASDLPSGVLFWLMHVGNRAAAAVYSLSYMTHNIYTPD